MVTTCEACGVKITDNPEDKDLYEIQRNAGDDEDLCVACAHPDDYGCSGAECVLEADVVDQIRQTGGEPDEVLADLLANAFKAEELRRWVGSRDDVARQRGDTKRETAERAVGQARPEAIRAIASDNGFEGTDVDAGVQPHEVHCAQCAYSDAFGSEEAAVEAAKAHKSDNPTHFPKAWADDGRALYGH